MTLRPASYKGVPFYVEDSEGSYGRRTVLHKYPYRDIPYLEDLGRDTRGFSFTAFVMTQSAHDKLVEAIEAVGAGTLIHPYYGSHFVAHEGQVRVQYPRAEGGRFVFQLSFTEAGENIEPDATEDEAGLLESLVNDALEAVGLEFSTEWAADIDGWMDMAVSRIDSLLEGFEQFLTPVERALAGVQRLISGGQSLLAKPLELYYRVAGLVNKASNLFKLPFGSKINLSRQLVKSPAFTVSSRPDKDTAILQVLSGIKLQAQTRPSWTLPHIATNERDLPPMPPTLADAVRRTLVLEQARGLAINEYDSKADILQERDVVLEQLQLEMYQADGVVFKALQAVRAQVVRVADARIPNLHEIKTIHTQAVLPALLLAYQTNTDIDAYSDLVARNKVAHPLFVPAGLVEVMLDGK